MQQATLIYNAVISEHKLSFFLWVNNWPYKTLNQTSSNYINTTTVLTRTCFQAVHNSMLY
jgi:hypothetical protein